MKRLVFWISILALLTAVGLSSYVVQPEHFTGAWFGVDGTAYQFQEGLIHRIDQNGFPQEHFNGAYSFTGNSITLFVTRQEGASEIITLYWIGEKDGDTLRENTQKNSPLRFCRNRSKAMQEKKTSPIS